MKIAYRLKAGSEVIEEGVKKFLNQHLEVPVRGVVFDMDGTLNLPSIDFELMHRRSLSSLSSLLLTLTLTHSKTT